MSIDLERKIMNFAALIGRMESTLMACDNALAFAESRVWDKKERIKLVVARNEIQARLREARNLFPSSPKIDGDDPTGKSAA